MKVRLLERWAGPHGSFYAGEIVDLPENIALILLGEDEEQAGAEEGLPPQAERVDQKLDAVPPLVAEDYTPGVERAVDEVVEQRERADDPPHKRKGRRRGVGDV